MGMTPSRRPGAGLYQPLADINVTPLVDVMLVLLIVFMITAPMLAAGVKINLPQAKKSAQPMKAKLLGAEDTPIRLRGDKESSYGDIIGVLDLLSSNGLTKIALMSDARRGPAPASAEPAVTPELSTPLRAGDAKP